MAVAGDCVSRGNLGVLEERNMHVGVGEKSRHVGESWSAWCCPSFCMGKEEVIQPKHVGAAEEEKQVEKAAV